MINLETLGSSSFCIWPYLAPSENLFNSLSSWLLLGNMALNGCLIAGGFLLVRSGLASQGGPLNELESLVILNKLDSRQMFGKHMFGKLVGLSSGVVLVGLRTD